MSDTARAASRRALLLADLMSDDDDDWETDPDHENPPSRGPSKASSSRQQVRNNTGATVLHVCTGGACRRDGAHATLVELEELARHVSLGVERYNCFGLCGRGPNVSVDFADGREDMHHGVRSTRQSLDIIERATGARPEVDDAHATRLSELRRSSRLEQQLAEVQELVDVLDCKPPAQRASANCQRQYDDALARVDAVLREVPASHRPLADAVRRQVVAARAGRPPSPDVEDVYVDEPDTWPRDR